MKKSDATKLAVVAEKAMEDIKAHDIVKLDVRKLTTVTDYMLLATGTSSRHVRSIAQNVLEEARKAGWRSIGSEGNEAGEWILVDFGSVVVHVMGAEARQFYGLEKLWSQELEH